MKSEIRDDYYWLYSDRTLPLLDLCRQQSSDSVNVVSIAKSLRKQTTPARAALIMELTRLRIRAEKKFSRANTMGFTRRGYEQSTSEPVARFKAQRFAGIGSVADVCCGIGGDLIAIADREGAEKTFGIDCDPLCLMMAATNAEAYDCRVSLVETTFDEFDASMFDAIHIDPDRRVDGRSVKPDLIEPPLNSILEKYSDRKSLAVKLAPATEFDDDAADVLCGPGIERHWIGDRRECKQQVLWTGSLVRYPDSRVATRVFADGTFEEFAANNELLAKQVPLAEVLGKYIFEPHAAVRAAHLTDAIAHSRNLRRLEPRIPYLTGSRPDDVGLLSMFRILDVMQTNVRKIAVRLKELDAREIEVKHRGVEQVSADQVKRIILDGSKRLTVILTRFSNKRIAIIAQRKKLRKKQQIKTA